MRKTNNLYQFDTHSFPGVIISVETNAEKHIAHHKEIEHLMEEEMERFRQHCEAQEKEIEILREALTKNNIPIGKYT